jgi:hypothetical protein
MLLQVRPPRGSAHPGLVGSIGVMRWHATQPVGTDNQANQSADYRSQGAGYENPEQRTLVRFRLENQRTGEAHNEARTAYD